MQEAPNKDLLPVLRSRQEYFDYLDKWTVETVDNLRAQFASRTLVKAYLLETSRSQDSSDPVLALKASNQHITRVDESFSRIRSPGQASDWALLETDDPRYPIFYTLLEANEATKRIDKIVQCSPFLDKAWFAAPMFTTLWGLITKAQPYYRFSRLVFEYESLFESNESGRLKYSRREVDGEDEERPLPIERRRARMQITERIGMLNNVLTTMQEIYSPLKSIIQLRVPAPQRGGHDVYFDGRFTNRSDSATSFRQTINTVKDLYRRSTVSAEKAAWPTVSRSQLSLGSPLLIQFSQELPLSTFDRWITSLQRKTNPFRLWAKPIRLGPGKAHLYAIDNHLWQPIDLEMTTTHVYAVLPSGTCGNTIHRLVTNVQRFIDPKAEAFIGQKPYKDFLTPDGHSG